MSSRFSVRARTLLIYIKDYFTTMETKKTKQPSALGEQAIKDYIEMLQEAQDTLTAISADTCLDDAILTSLRNLGEIKAFFKLSLEA